MIVRYKGATSSSKDLPGEGPQGTLLGLLLFLVLINDAGFDNQENRVGENVTSRKLFKAANLFHLKYVDDMPLMESIKLKDALITVPESARPLPDSYQGCGPSELIGGSSMEREDLSMVDFISIAA